MEMLSILLDFCDLWGESSGGLPSQTVKNASIKCFPDLRFREALVIPLQREQFKPVEPRLFVLHQARLHKASASVTAIIKIIKLYFI